MNQFKHGIPKQERVLSIVETPRHFVKVGWKMLRRDPMPRSHNPALQERECRFDRVGMNVAVNVDLGAVWNRLMLAGRDADALQGERVGNELIRHNHVNIFAHIFLDVFRQGAGLRILSMKKAEIAAALPDADNYFFRFLASVDAPTDLFAAYIGFIYFDCAIQLLKGNIFGHSMTDAVTEIPCRAVVNSEHPLKLVSRHSLAGLAEQIDGQKPLSKWQVRIVENRASRNGELIAA